MEWSVHSQPAEKSLGSDVLGRIRLVKGETVDLGDQRKKREGGGVGAWERSPGGMSGCYDFASRSRTLEKGFQVLLAVLKTFMDFYCGPVSMSVLLAWNSSVFFLLAFVFIY